MMRSVPTPAVVFELCRPFTLLAPMVGVVAGAGAAVGASDTALSAPLMLRITMGIIMAGLLNAASNALNQVFDIDVDSINKPDRPLPSGRLSTAFALGQALFLYGIALLLAWPLSNQNGPECFALVCIAALFTVVYSVPPFRTKRFGWMANLTIAIPRGLLLKVAGWSIVAPVFSNAEPWVLGGLFFLFLVGASTAKDYADIEGDQRGGIQSLPIRLGWRKAHAWTSPFYVLPWLLMMAIPLLPNPLLTASPLGLIVLGGLCAAYGIWVVLLLRDEPTRMGQEGNHLAWFHMYVLMMTAQVGSCLVYVL